MRGSEVLGPLRRLTSVMSVSVTAPSFIQPPPTFRPYEIFADLDPTFELSTLSLWGAR